MKVHDMEISFPEGQTVRIEFSDDVSHAEALVALNTFKLELMRSIGEPKFHVIAEQAFKARGA